MEIEQFRDGASSPVNVLHRDSSASLRVWYVSLSANSRKHACLQVAATGRRWLFKCRIPELRHERHGAKWPRIPLRLIHTLFYIEKMSFALSKSVSE